jgi:hypothetical protein
MAKICKVDALKKENKVLYSRVTVLGKKSMEVDKKKMECYVGSTYIRYLLTSLTTG